jgi:Family of unknown function (DUF6459)
MNVPQQLESGSRPILRLLPPPDCDPPSAEGSPLARESASPFQGTLALAFALPSGVPAVPDAPRSLRLIHGYASPDGEEFSLKATPRNELPDPRPWTARLVQALVEIQSGDRPLSQLLRWTTADVYALTAKAVAQRTVVTNSASRRDQARAVLRSVHICEPDDGVVEACAVVRLQNRCQAIALRLEGIEGRWRCTSLVWV